MKSMHKITKQSLSFIMIVMMIFSLSVLSNAASGEYLTIIADKDGTIGYNESFSQSFTLNYNSQVRIFFNGYKSSYHGTYGKHKVEIKNDSGEVVYTVSGNTSYSNKEYLTDELPGGNYTLYVYCDSTSTSSEFDFCLNLSYKVLEDVPVESIALDKSTLYLCPKDKATLNVKFTPAESNGKTATWKSSNTKVATVSTTGEVTAVAKGTATITATVGDKKATCKVTVFSTEGKTKRTLVSNQQGTIEEGEVKTHKFTLKAASLIEITLRPYSYGEYEFNIKDSNKKVVYSIQDKIGYTTEYLTIPVLPKGTYTLSLTTTSDEFDYNYDIAYTVLEDVAVESLAIDKSTLYICNNDKSTLKAKFTPVESDDKKVTWKSSNTKVATVSSSGEVTGVAKGTATITATAGGKSATCKVTVFSTDGRSYKTLVSTQKGTVYEGKYKTNKFTLSTYSRIKISFTDDSYGSYELNIKDSNGKVVYTVKSKCSYADKSHTVKALPKGTYTFNLTATDYDFDYDYKISYMVLGDVAVKSVALNNSTLNLCIGSKSTLKATITPADADYNKITWKSSNTKVATVSSSGVVTGVAKGTATITATSGGKSKTCKVNVFSTDGKVYKTLVSTQNGTVYEDNYKTHKFTLNAYSRIKISFTDNSYGDYIIKIKDSNGKVVYSVSDRVAYDDQSKTTPILPKGTYAFSITAGDRYSSLVDDFRYEYKISYMTVADVTLKKVKLSSTSVTLAKGKTTTLTATPDPSYVTKKTTWSSSNTKVATVSSSGKITAKALGTATITAKIGDKKATCSVKVGSASATVIKKRSTSLASYITNISGYKNATWSTSNSSIATVDKNGKVYGKSNGTCSVYCTVNKVKYTFNITVKPAVSASVYYIKDTDIYNEISLKLVNNTNLNITYITMNINQYDNRGYKLKSPYSSFEFNDTLNANSSCYTEEYWVNDATKKATVTVKKVWFSDGTTWTP